MRTAGVCPAEIVWTIQPVDHKGEAQIWPWHHGDGDDLRAGLVRALHRGGAHGPNCRIVEAVLPGLLRECRELPSRQIEAPIELLLPASHLSAWDAIAGCSPVVEVAASGASISAAAREMAPEMGRRRGGFAGSGRPWAW